MAASRTKLNDRQKAFCREYLVDFNASAAAVRAGYSAKSAKNHAWEIRNSPSVQAHLKILLAARDKKTDVTAERTLAEIARLAFHNPADYYKRDGNGVLVLKDIDELTPDERAAVAEYDPEKKTLKLYSKDPSLDKLGKHFKLFSELHEQLTSFTIMPELKLGGNTIIFNVGEPVRKK